MMATVAKPLPPLPIISTAKNEPDTQNAKTPSQADPLESLMAPPSRTPVHGTGQGGLADLMAPPRVARSHFSEPRVKTASRLSNANVPSSA